MNRSQTAQNRLPQPTFRLFGRVWLEVGGQELHFRTRKNLALLSYLLLEEGLHSRGKLAALLWPEVDEADGRASLRAALSELKKNLGPLAESLLVSNKEALGFSSNHPVWVDVRELEAAFKHAGNQNQESNLEANLQAAANLGPRQPGMTKVQSKRTKACPRRQNQTEM